MTDHPINPPSLALIKKWIIDNGLTVSIAEASAIASLASRLGADQELEACCDSLQELLAPSDWITSLRTARRPKLPSLKEQALAVLDDASDRLDAAHENIIRRALEQLDG